MIEWEEYYQIDRYEQTEKRDQIIETEGDDEIDRSIDRSIDRG